MLLISKILLFLQIMSKTLSKIFPVLDHLYIFQIQEYKTWDFLKWFSSHPFARNLQKKHILEFTFRMKLMLLFVGIWLFISIEAIGLLLTLLALIFLSPAFIILAHLTFLPLDFYFKSFLLNQAKEKLAGLRNLKIIAITGSYGKTSAKDILYTLLWKKFRVVKTPKSYNTPIGLAQTILDYLKPNSEIFIAEIGAYKKGEIRELSQLLNPAIGVITAVGPQHLERFGSLENIAEAKFELAENLKKGGLAILNGEYELIRNHAITLQNTKIKYYGQSSDYYTSDIQLSQAGTSFTFHTPRATTHILLPLIGEHHVKNFVAAAVTALELGLSLGEIKERTKYLLPTPHRLEIKKQGSLTIIDNTYNTNPQSSKIALQLLSDIPGAQKILITPGLVEQGYEKRRANRDFAKNAAKIVNQIIIVGEYAKTDLLAGLSVAKFTREKVSIAKSLNEAMHLLGTVSKPGAVVLLENDLPDQYF